MIIKISDEIVRSVVTRSLSSKVQVIDHKTEPLSKLNTGMIASHYILTVRVKEDDVLHTFFVKSAYDLVSAGSNKTPLQDQDFFSEEVRFFREILPKLGNDTGFAPKCWLANQEMLIFEDLRSTGYSMHSDSAFLSHESSKLALSALAKLHASSVFAEGHLGRPLNNLYPFRESHFCPESRLSRSVNVSLRTASQLSSHFGYPEASLKVDQLARLVRLDDKFNVICHGDVWRNNLMFRPDDCILVDYQLLRYTSPGVDLAMFVYLNCSPELRKISELEMIKHYYCCFSKACGKLKIPSFEKILRAYEERKLLGAFYAAMFLPRVLSPVEVHHKLLENKAELEEYLFGDRFQVILSIMKEYPEYELAIRNIIKEYSELIN